MGSTQEDFPHDAVDCFVRRFSLLHAVCDQFISDHVVYSVGTENIAASRPPFDDVSFAAENLSGADGTNDDLIQARFGVGTVVFFAP